MKAEQQGDQYPSDDIEHFVDEEKPERPQPNLDDIREHGYRVGQVDAARGQGRAREDRHGSGARAGRSRALPGWFRWNRRSSLYSIQLKNDLVASRLE